MAQINSKDENWLSHIELNHDPKQKFSFNYAHIIDASGKIVRKLKKKELITYNDLSYQAFYQDDLITEFDLYWNQYPYKIEYSYTIQEDEYLYLSWWSPLYYTSVGTIKASLEVNIPSVYPLQIEASENLDFEEVELEKRKILKWQSSLYKNESRQGIYLPPRDIATVKIVPKKFTYGIPGSSQSWEEFGSWLYELNKGTDQLPFSEKSTIEEILQEEKSDEEIVRRIYHHLQDYTKYVNVAIDVGGLKSYPASYVCENKYGDCKALTTYMRAMLNSAEIASFYTIIKAGEGNPEIDIDFPSQQFNHVILVVPQENDTIWLENTANYLPFNYLGTFTQNRYALAISNAKSQLVKTPMLSPEDVLFRRNYNFYMKDQNKMEINTDLILRGEEFENFRYYLSMKDKEHQNDKILDHTGIQDFNNRDWSIIDFHRDSTFLRLNTSGTSSSIIRQIGTFQVINPLRIKIPDFEKPNDRTLDVNISFPINRFDESTFHLSISEKREIELPEDIQLESRYGSYQTKYLMEENFLKVSEKFTLLANRIPIKEYRDFFAFVEAIKTHKKKAAILIK